MQAAVYHRFGPPEVLQIEPVSEPCPRSDEALVQVRAASVNPKDVLMRKGKFRWLARRRAPMRTAFDLSGVVLSAPPGSGFVEGDSIFAMLGGWDGGAMAERAAVPVGEMARMPSTLDYAEAASVPLAAQTALQALRDLGDVGRRDRVIINGASGGVGTFAIQLAKLLGAKVTAVCSSRNAELCRSLGADNVEDYKTLSAISMLRECDVFFDVFGNRSFAEVRPLLGRRGRYISTVPSPKLFLQTVMARVSRPSAQLVVVRSRRRDLEFLAQAFEAGQLVATIDRRYRLDEIREAHRHIETKRTRGKVVVEVGNCSKA